MKIFSTRALLVSLMLLAGIVSRAQDFMFQGFYWDYPERTGIARWGQGFMGKIPELQSAGFTYVWLPPLSRASGSLSSVGYDVEDYYDLGSYAGSTRFGTRRDVDSVVMLLKRAGIHPVADMVFNQRAGGLPEDNISVQGWVENFNSTKLNAPNYNLPYPSDRFRCYILLGDTTHNGVGTYYIDIRSASQDPSFYNFAYDFRAWTHKIPLAVDSLHDSYEYEPNQGGKCGSAPGDTSNFYIMGTRKYCTIDGAGCGIDEFRIKLDTSMFNIAGDTLFLSVTNSNTGSLGDFSDQYVYGIWNDTIHTDVTSQIRYQTNTDFTHMPSGRGAMTEANFKPNGSPCTLNGSLDQMLFYYDIDQNVPSTQQTLIDWTQWMFDSINIEGLRLDAVKNYPFHMVSQLLDSLHNHGHNPGLVVGEYYDGNASYELGYIDSVENNMAQSTRDSIKMRLFDFGLRFSLQSACDQFGYDERSLYGASMRDAAGASGFNVVTFVNNHDFRDTSQLILHNPELAYAYILTNNQLGLPCVFYSDFFGNNFMQGRIKGLMKAHSRYIYGATSVNYLNNYNSSYSTSFVNNHGYATTTLVYQLNNTQQVIVAINFAGDSLDVYQQVDTAFIAVGDTFTDIFGVADTLTTITPFRELHVKLPPRSFGVYVKGNHKDSLISLSDTTVITRVGIEQPAEQAQLVHVYPNPFSNQLEVEINGPVNGSIQTEIYDVSGRRVFTRSFSNGMNQLMFDPGITSAGFYILKVNAGSEEHYFKLVKH